MDTHKAIAELARWAGAACQGNAASAEQHLQQFYHIGAALVASKEFQASWLATQKIRLDPRQLEDACACCRRLPRSRRIRSCCTAAPRRKLDELRLPNDASRRSPSERSKFEMTGEVTVAPSENLSRSTLWAAVVFGLVYPTILTWVYFSLLQEARPGVQQGVYSVGKAIQFGLPAIWALAIERRWFVCARPRLSTVIGGLASGLAIAAVIFGGYQVLAGSPQIAAAATAVQARVASIGFSNRTGFILLGLFYAGLHSWLEEFYWRWFVFGRLRELVPPAAAIVVSSLGFMAHHVIVLLTYFPVPLAIALSAAVAFAGEFWAWLYQRTGSLYGAWLSHMLADAAIFAVGYQMIFA